LCWNLYRKRYQDKPYQNNVEVKRRYELSDKGRQRKLRYQNGETFKRGYSNPGNTSNTSNTSNTGKRGYSNAAKIQAQLIRDQKTKNAIIRITGARSMKSAFSDHIHVKKLKAALQSEDQRLLKVWGDLSEIDRTIIELCPED
jgi:hypothetical protein